MLRLLQIIVACLTVPMMCLGIMAALSGGGDTAGQRVGPQLIVIAFFAGLVGIITSWVFERFNVTPLAYAALAVTGVVFVGLLIWLHRETGFFTW